MRKLLSLMGAFALWATAASANLSIGTVFSSHMVLQRGVPVPVWGMDAPGQAITIRFNGQEKKTRSNAEGKWTVALEAMAAGGPYTMTCLGSGPQVTLTNVMVGEVWICAGQSNMQYAMRDKVDNRDAEIASADQYPAIRLFASNKLAGYSGKPQETITSGTWSVCSSRSVRDFSAAGYFFGRQLEDSALKGVPIGLIDAAIGATTVECWIAEPVLHQYYGADLRGAGLHPDLMFGHPLSGCFNGMINPWIPYAIRGVIWYQGESNSRYPEQYLELFPLLVKDWRSRWHNDKMPFFYVQLPNLTPGKDDPGFALLREAQLLALQHIDYAGMAVTIDVGDPKDLHPSHKLPVGQRLALLARALVYGEKVVCSGPLYEKKTVEGNTIRITFKEVGGGLVDKNGGALEGFEIAGADGVFRPASATIRGSTVLVSCPEVKDPVNVRYAWGGNPVADLVNSENLPASPFRTDPAAPTAKAKAIFSR